MTSDSKVKTYSADSVALAFPLGGIGTGNVSLGARGNLIDWEIFNRPGKGTTLPNTFVALRTQVADESPITRILEGPIATPHLSGTGYHPTTTAGLPRLEGVTVQVEYPLAKMAFHDAALPVSVNLEAYTPLVPLNAEDSGIPCAIFNYSLTNTSTSPVSLTLVSSMMNPVGGLTCDLFSNPDPNQYGPSVTTINESPSCRGLFMTADQLAPDQLEFGSCGLFTDHPHVSMKPQWLRGEWFDFLREFWDDLVDDGLLNNLNYSDTDKHQMPDTGSLGLVDTLQPGESKTYRFVLTWYFPNRHASWFYTPDRVIRNHYATRFSDAADVAHYVFKNLSRLEQATHDFNDALFGTTLPAYVIDALASNLVPIRSNTCFWLEDGKFYAWEGCFDTAGSCPGTCTHVWSYAQSAAFLFPSLERVMREIEFLDESEDDGFMPFRAYKQFGERVRLPNGDRREAAVDGQLGSIVRVYREWLLSGDRSWLATLWPSVTQSLRFATDHWDPDKDGVLEGRQHNTFDIEFYGPNPLGTVFYLAALRAGEALAQIMDDVEIAAYCRDLFEKGSARFDEIAWNGDYYVQPLDDVDAYRYQHGLGCLSNQLVGQWHARLLGLGDLLPNDHITKAIHAIYQHNFLEDFSEHVNVQRTFAMHDEAGLILCSWPHGGRPRFPFVYSDEVWTGVEYYVAALLIYEGWLDEGLHVIKAVRDRYDGIRRNPLNEVECGHHYARSMSSWSVLQALTQFSCDVDRRHMSFVPKMEASTDSGRFSSIWSTGTAWGTYTQERNQTTDDWDVSLEVLGGNVQGFTLTANGQTINLDQLMSS